MTNVVLFFTLKFRKEASIVLLNANVFLDDLSNISTEPKEETNLREFVTKFQRKNSSFYLEEKEKRIRKTSTTDNFSKDYKLKPTCNFEKKTKISNRSTFFNVTYATSSSKTDEIETL